MPSAKPVQHPYKLSYEATAKKKVILVGSAMKDYISFEWSLIINLGKRTTFEHVLSAITRQRFNKLCSATMAVWRKLITVSLSMPYEDLKNHN